MLSFVKFSKIVFFYQTRFLSNLIKCRSQQTISLFFIFYFYIHFSFHLFFVMISFDQFAFFANDFRNNYIVKIVEHVRKQQFVVYINFYEIIILFFHFANFTKTTFKRFFNDVINIVNNDIASKKRRKRFSKSKNNQRVFSIKIFAFYNFIFFNLLLYVFVKKYVDLRVSRIVFFSFFNFFFQEKNDDYDFDEFFFIRLYANFVDHESNQKFEHVSNRNNDKKKITFVQSKT